MKILSWKYVALAVAAVIGCQASAENVEMTFKLHGQTRRFAVEIVENGGDVVMKTQIMRNGALQKCDYTITAESRKNARRFSYPMPTNGVSYTLPADATFALLSQWQFNDVKTKGECRADNAVFTVADTKHGIIHLIDKAEGCEMWVRDDQNLPLIVEMRNNPLEINWKTTPHITPASTPLEEIAADKRKGGGTYFAYPWASELPLGITSTGCNSTLPPRQSLAPEGFEPVYISHYGRHGSRWITDDERYLIVVNLLDSAKSAAILTPLGEETLHAAHKAWEDAQGRVGHLSPLGYAQHKGIAKRLIANYPRVFAGNALVDAKSSIKPRCIMSMMAFCESLKEVNRDLSISAETGQRYMEYINPTSQTAKQLDSKTSPWYTKFMEHFNATMPTNRVVANLFTKNPFSDRLREVEFVDALYWLAVNMQDTTCDADFMHLFTADDLHTIANLVNCRMYVRNTRCPLLNGEGAKIARPLLKQIVEEADSALAGNRIAAHLRFGHDTALLQLMSLMGVECCDSEMTDPQEFSEKWQLFKVSPMGANLQMIFYRNAQGETLVKLLHNEVETTIPSLSPYSGNYYRWSDLRKKFIAM